MRAYLENNRTKFRANSRRWEKEHREQRAAIVQARVAKDKAAHPEKYVTKERDRWQSMSEDEKERRKSHQRDRYAKDPQRRADIRKSTTDHPETKKAANASYTARKRGAPVRTLTASEWKLIRDIFDGKCAYCVLPGRMTQDHIIPLSKGGGHCLNNVVPACQSCNSKKHNGLPLRPVQPLML